ncbi:MAG: peptide chain release factor N(5)-glutamine methyltransferase [Moraxellaceae bacterium]|nr:peptide chain release factor N(5)-glutamine methyltransferase [Moraxellaceae bacterium]
MNISQLQQHALSQLTGEEARLEIELLLAHVLSKSRTFLRTWPTHELSPTQLAQFEQYVALRQQGVPLAYILGERAFWSLNLTVTPDVLIPRPDTESVVEKVLALGQGKQWRRVADLGTGSGAIALSLALENPTWHVIATDIHAPSLKVAQANANKHHIHNVEFALGSWFEPLTGLFDCIVSNPPYIVENDPHLSQLTHEPLRALVAPEQGLADLAHLVRLSSDFLKIQGWLVLEHGFDQGLAVRELLTQAKFSSISTGQDYGGNDRYTVGQYVK